MNKSITIIDYGMGNIHSVAKQILKYGIEIIVSSTASEIKKSEKIILPGVGHFGEAMKNLYKLRLIEPLSEFVFLKKKPILGICLGMQIMSEHSEEGNAQGLGWIGGNVVRFNIDDKQKFKVPHIGWNKIQQNKKSYILDDIKKDDEFYFVHSFHFIAKNNKDILCTTEYGYPFTSAIEQENIFGVQFHPEKSHEAGNKILLNFITI